MKHNDDAHGCVPISFQDAYFHVAEHARPLFYAPDLPDDHGGPERAGGIAALGGMLKSGFSLIRAFSEQALNPVYKGRGPWLN